MAKDVFVNCTRGKFCRFGVQMVEKVVLGAWGQQTSGVESADMRSNAEELRST